MLSFDTIFSAVTQQATIRRPNINVRLSGQLSPVPSSSILYCTVISSTGLVLV